MSQSWWTGSFSLRILMLSSQLKKKKKSSKMIRRRERGEVLEAPEIPSDLQIEIVNRLSIKSLARFKCVSKFWFSVIHSRGYLFPSPPRLYISLICDETETSVLLSLSFTSSKSTIVFHIDSTMDSTMDGIGGYYMVAFRGLIFHTFHTQACIYNPTTRQRVTLPKIQFNILAQVEYMTQIHYFLGYDPVLDQYKVVCSALVWLEKFEKFVGPYWWVFVLETGSCWKRIECNHPHSLTGRHLCMNGLIYFLAYNFVDMIKFMSFDVRSEEFSMIQLPHVMFEHKMSVGLIEYGGKPTLFDYTNLKDSLVNLWVLEDAGTWSKKSLVLQLCQMHLFHDNGFNVIGTTQNGEVVLKPKEMSSPYYILYYDLHTNDVRRVDIRGISEEPDYVALMDTGESIMHLKI